MGRIRVFRDDVATSGKQWGGSWFSWRDAKNDRLEEKLGNAFVLAVDALLGMRRQSRPVAER